MHKQTVDFKKLRMPTASYELKAGVVAGLFGALAFLVAMLIDLALTRRRTNDLRLLAGLIPAGARHWPWLGFLMHCFNGAMLGILFSRLSLRLPGPYWLRGILFAQGENVLLWPIIMALDRLHPEIQTGRLEPFHRPVPFLQEVWRHFAYGVTLGWLYNRLVTSPHHAEPPTLSPNLPTGTVRDV